ncbi:RNA 2',3'-cyclic phosphodiesterase [Candidatus Woesearchaeota archaeon]|nr:RNA 2',3'-cyclic phosphodiesterase [Candidatus Woesearchaeota archaeon]
MRLFTAIEIPESIKNSLAKVQDKIDSRAARIRLVDKSQMHITLKFLGKVSEEKAEGIKERLKQVKVKPFCLILDKVGFFPNENYIRVVWAGIRESEELIKIQEDVEDALREFGFKKDYKFHPHITLARVKLVDDRDKFIESLKKIKLEKERIDVKDFRLVKSTLTPKGPVYEDIAVF